MNIDWIDFLKSNGINLTKNSKQQSNDGKKSATNSICPLTDFSLLRVTGTDATQFLQGQLTCNIDEINESNSFFTAFCNAKGRTITTLVILKVENGFLILLPTKLEEKVTNKLRMYILRSDVKLTSATQELCLIGLTTQDSKLIPNLPTTDFAVFNHCEIIIKFPSEFSRYLVIAPLSKAKSLWSFFSSKKLSISHPNTWSYQDISAGLPWLTETTSEEYIPQMLNIDKLGGISFNKGCYTGQEIIARTHYLGKTKRELFLAECKITAMLENDIQIISDSTGKSVGKIISAQNNEQHTRVLIVLSTAEAGLSDLKLNNEKSISIIDYQ